MRQLVVDKLVEFVYYPTDVQLADFFTILLDSQLFKRFRNSIMVQYSRAIYIPLIDTHTFFGHPWIDIFAVLWALLYAIAGCYNQYSLCLAHKESCLQFTLGFRLQLRQNLFKVTCKFYVKFVSIDTYRLIHTCKCLFEHARWLFTSVILDSTDGCLRCIRKLALCFVLLDGDSFSCSRDLRCSVFSLLNLTLQGFLQFFPYHR